MESDKRESQILKPNSQNKLQFDSDYKNELTFYINEKDSSVRPKKLILLLKRLKDNNIEMLYGKLIIDIAKFYQKDESSNVVIRDMESGRSVAPTFNGSFLLYPKPEENHNIVGDNVDDLTFKIAPETDFLLSDWDVSFIEDDDYLNNNNNNEMKKNNKKKPQTLAEDEEFIKKAEELEKRKFFELLNIYSKQQTSSKDNFNNKFNNTQAENGIDIKSRDILPEDNAQSDSSASGELSEEELDKDKEIGNTASDQKEEDSHSEEDFLDNENILTANDDNMDDAILFDRKRLADAPQEGEDNLPEPSNNTEGTKKKKRYYNMIVKGAIIDGENSVRPRRVTFNLKDDQKAIDQNSGKDINGDETSSQSPTTNRRSSFTYIKPGVDANSVGAKVNLAPSSKPRLSVPSITLNITPGVKLGSVGVKNLNLPSRENSSLNSPRNPDASESSETKLEDKSSSEADQKSESSDQQQQQLQSQAFPSVIPAIRRSVSSIESIPPLIGPAGVPPGIGVGVTVGAGNKAGIPPGTNTGSITPPSAGPGVRPGMSVGVTNLAGVGIRNSTCPGVPPLGIGAGSGIGHGAGFYGAYGEGAPPGVAAGAGVLPGVSIGAPVGVGAQVGPTGLDGVKIGASGNVGVRNNQVGANLNQGQPSQLQSFVTQKRVSQPSLNQQSIGNQLNLNNGNFNNPGYSAIRGQPYSGNTTPRNNNPTLTPNHILTNNQINPIRQSTQPNQPTLGLTSESGTMSEPFDEESGSIRSSNSQISKFPGLNPQLRQQILLQQQRIQQQQLQLQNQNRNPVQVRIPPNMTSVTSSTNPNFNVPMIPGLPSGNYSTSGSVSPRSPTTPSSIRTESANEASDDASMSTASFESPRNNSTSTSATPTPTPTPTTNSESVPKSSFTNQGPIPSLNPVQLQNPPTRRRSSLVNVESLPPEIQRQIDPNNTGKNVEVEYEYEYEYDDFEDDQGKNAEDQKKKSEMLAAQEKKMEVDYAYCIHVVITHQWRVMTNAPKFAPDRAYPCQVFPIFATILHTQILKSEKSIKPQFRHQHQVLFDKCLQMFATDMQKMPATHGDLFLTTLLIILLIRTQAQKYRLDRKRCETALKSIQRIFESSLLMILERPLDKAEVYIEIFSEANFQPTQLLRDFHEIFESNKTSFMFGEVINNFLITRFTELLEGKMLNRIISKPDKFTFSNAVKWNSFLTAFENDNNISMKTIHQAVNVFIMIESIAKSPSLAKEICPDIQPALVSFFLTHFKKDENIQNPPKPSKFNKEYKLNKAPKTFEHVPAKKTSLTLTTIKQEFTLNNWNDLSPDEPNVKAFSFLAKHIKSNEQPVIPSALSTQDIS